MFDKTIKFILLLNLFLKINSLFRLYNTDVNDSKGCLYSNTMNTK